MLAVVALAEPDAVTRGRSTTIVVKGSKVETLKTLQVSPPDGVRLGEITPAKDGSQAVTVVVTVDATAKPGERELTLVVAPTVATAGGARPAGDDEMAQQMDQFVREIIKRETKPVASGALHINAHDVKITKVEVVGGQVRVTATDEAGDIVADSGGGEETIREIKDPLIAEAHCADEIVYGLLWETRVQGQPPAVTLVADLDPEGLAGKTACELRVRVRDKDGNLSGWSTTKLDVPSGSREDPAPGAAPTVPGVGRMVPLPDAER
jgi:hypothetical protein